MKKILGLLAIAAMMLAVVAGPAAADPGAGVLSGTADVGRSYTGNCVANSISGNGLFLPTIQDGNGFYRLNATTVSAPGALGSINVCGKLRAEPITGLGAACGASQGYDGTGTANTSVPAATVNLSNVGWIASVGGTLPTTGDYTPAGTKLTGGNTGGTLVAIVQAQGGANCVAGPHNDGTGAKSFAVVGAFALLQGV